MVLRLRSSESVLERDEEKKEITRVFTVHQAKHVLRLKPPEMIAAKLFWKKQIHLQPQIVQYVFDQYLMLYKKAAVLLKSSSTTIILMKQLARGS